MSTLHLRRIMAGVIAVGLMASMAACTTPAPGSSGPNTDKVVLPEIGKAPADLRVDLITLQRLGLPSDQTLGANLAATSAGVSNYTWFGPPGINPPAALSAFQTAVAAGSKGVVVAALPDDLFGRPIDDAVDAGTAVVTVDVPAPNSEASAHFGPSRFALGVALAKEWSDKLGTNAKGYIQPGNCSPTVPVLVSVIDGFRAEMDKLQPGVETKEALDVTADPTSNFTSWQQVITQESDALGFFGVCDQDTPNLVKIKESTGGTYLIGTTSGDTVETLKAVKKGVLDTVVSQDGFVQGYTAMYFVLQKLINDKEIPKGWFNTGLQVINKDNVDPALERLTSKDPKVSFLYYQSVIEKLIASQPVGFDTLLTSPDPGPTLD